MSGTPSGSSTDSDNDVKDGRRSSPAIFLFRILSKIHRKDTCTHQNKPQQDLDTEINFSQQGSREKDTEYRG